MQESCRSALHWDEQPVMGSLVVINGYQEEKKLNWDCTKQYRSNA